MAEQDIDRLLTDGLVSGYAGGTEIKTIQRGQFTLDSSEYRSSDGGYYIDQWGYGSGQELASKSGETASRAYKGGTIPKEKLAELGTTKSAVISYLKEKIKQLGEQTRLRVDCLPEPDGDWLYSYKVLQQLNDVDLTISLEEITYKGVRVFAHGFMR